MIPPAGKLVFEMVTRDTYRWDNYRLRQEHVDKLIDLSDVNYRTLYSMPGKHIIRFRYYHKDVY